MGSENLLGTIQSCQKSVFLVGSTSSEFTFIKPGKIHSEEPKLICKDEVKRGHSIPQMGSLWREATYPQWFPLCHPGHPTPHSDGPALPEGVMLRERKEKKRKKEKCQSSPLSIVHHVIRGEFYCTPSLTVLFIFCKPLPVSISGS